MYLYVFALFWGFGKALQACRAWDVVGGKEGLLNRLFICLLHVCVYVRVRVRMCVRNFLMACNH